MASARTVIIAGAGIGGLTAALTLARAGFDVEIFEEEPVLDEIGAGLQLSPNASRVLLALGLGERLKPHVVAPSEVSIKSSAGKEIARIPLGDLAAQRYGAPYWVIHRADLQSVLIEAVRASPNIRLALNAQVNDFERAADGVKVQGWRDRTDFSDYEPTDGFAFETRGIALIGADGLGSIMRYLVSRSFRRPTGDGELIYSNRTAWRATVPRDAVSAEFREPVVHLWLGRKAHLVHYPIRDGAAINIVAITNFNRNNPEWSKIEGTLAQVLPHYPRADWSERAQKILAASERWQRYQLFHRSPRRRWGLGPVTLLGDSAHLMLPYLAQGAAMAIEDAAVLADCLSKTPDEPEQALRRYEDERRPRTARVQRTARRNGLIYHLGGRAATARDFVLRRMSGEKLLTRFDWLYDWRPTPDTE
jgi:salicylate hydroxylase